MSVSSTSHRVSDPSSQSRIQSNVRYLPAPSRRPPDIAPEAVAFQSDSCAVEHAPVPPVARGMVWLLVLVIATAIGWACFAKLDRVVSTTGRLITPIPKLVIQPLEISSVRKINVEPGQTVRKGDVLAELDPTFVQADQAQLEKRRESLEARIARLRAEVIDADFAVGAGAGSDYLVQQALFAQRRRELDMKLASADQQLAQIDAALAGTRTSAGLLNNQLTLARDLEQMREKLAANGNVARSVLLETRQRRLEVEVAQKAATDKLTELQHQGEALRAQRAGFLEEWHRTAAEELIAARTDHGDIVEQIQKAERKSSLVLLRAPEDAVVLEVADRSAGAVVQEAETLITLVPLNTTLEAEIEINASDVGSVAVDDKVRVKLDAFPFQRHGLLQGRLRTLSEDAFVRRPDEARGEGPANYYRARVELTTTQLRNVPEHNRLLPGMGVRGEILVGDRRVITYFLYPLIRALDESLREPV
ncbi:hemolysin secretion protein D [Skermanella stibiiresistens SB22]|uniref:Membrane fusion protein (MFP) family protein n=1 Tax=Skermanella stibiiresistens SB22 TaxID=1385369 RepID=W9GWA6_9PROT|nr:HlyD family type I secretion periplasmic adaptor subunit [Skermanella stibiiresistens]EWY38099.1 hemolysin secretion protein D [Skermanella stibiiresistens SB22]